MARKQQAPELTIYEKMRQAFPARDAVIQYYQAKYPGVKHQKNGKDIYEWKGKLADTLSGITGQSKKNMARRFQSSRETSKKPSKEVEKQYEQILQLLPPQAPPKGFNVSGTLYILYSECEPCENISFNVTGDNARKFVANPNIQGLINVYNKVPYDKSTNVVGPCSEEEGNSISVTVNQ